MNEKEWYRIRDILMIERQGLMIKKNGFTIGNAHELKSFLMSKCKNLRKQ